MEKSTKAESSIGFECCWWGHRPFLVRRHWNAENFHSQRTLFAHAKNILNFYYKRSVNLSETNEKTFITIIASFRHKTMAMMEVLVSRPIASLYFHKLNCFFFGCDLFHAFDEVTSAVWVPFNCSRSFQLSAFARAFPQLEKGLRRLHLRHILTSLTFLLQQQLRWIRNCALILIFFFPTF